MPASKLSANHPAVALVAHIILWAEERAERTVRYLQALGFRPKPTRGKLIKIPAEFALELSAILQIDAWEQSGVRPLLASDLPSAHSAMENLWARYLSSPGAYVKSGAGTELSSRVFQAWISCCVHAAPAELGVDMALAGRLDDSMMEVIADFLWHHRHLSDPEIQP